MNKQIIEEVAEMIEKSKATTEKGYLSLARKIYKKIIKEPKPIVTKPPKGPGVFFFKNKETKNENTNKEETREQ